MSLKGLHRADVDQVYSKAENDTTKTLVCPSMLSPLPDAWEQFWAFYL
jgi:hypothetical protein